MSKRFLPPHFVMEGASYQIFRTARAFGHAFRQIARAHDLNRTRGMLLSLLAHEPDGVTATALRQRIGVTAASISNMLADMEREGLITRTPHPQDARSMLVHMSDRAATIVRLFPQLVSEIEERAFAGFSTEDRQQLTSLLERVRANLGDDECDEFDFERMLKEREHID